MHVYHSGPHIQLQRISGGISIGFAYIRGFTSGALCQGTHVPTASKFSGFHVGFSLHRSSIGTAEGPLPLRDDRITMGQMEMLAEYELPPTFNELLAEAAEGSLRVAEMLVPLVYSQLRALALRRTAGERTDHTLQATALVHETYLKLVGPREINWPSETRLFTADAEERCRRQFQHSATSASTSCKLYTSCTSAAACSVCPF
jgi:hypothetical protein